MSYFSNPNFQVSSVAGELHDAALLYAFVADEMLRYNKDPRDGAEFLNFAPRVQFDGEYQVAISLIWY